MEFGEQGGDALLCRQDHNYCRRHESAEAHGDVLVNCVPSISCEHLLIEDGAARKVIGSRLTSRKWSDKRQGAPARTSAPPTKGIWCDLYKNYVDLADFPICKLWHFSCVRRLVEEARYKNSVKSKRENGQGAYRSSVPAFTMADKLAKTNPHCGLLRFVLRAPLLLYRIRLGGVLDDRFLLLKHTGREAACSGERFWRSWLR